MNQIVIENGYIISMNHDRQVFEGGDILIEGDCITALGRIPSGLVREDAERVNARGKLVMPGFINSHVHLSQQLARGLGDDVDLLTWLHQRIWPYESSMEWEDSYISSLACCIEMIRSGVTTFAEAGGQEVEGMARAVEETGIRGILARSTMDCGQGLPEKWQETAEETLAVQEDLISKWHGSAGGRIRVWFALRTIFNVSDRLIQMTYDLAVKYGVGIHMHVAEVREEVNYARKNRGNTTVKHLANLGALGGRLLAVHCVWLDEEEIELFAHHGVKVSHCPAAGMKVLGFARIPEMLDKGICISIGTDGAPCNNRMDIISDMYLASLIHKGRTLNPETLPAERILEMATVNGAKCLQWEDEIGSLEPGKKADLIIINPAAAGSLPVHDPVANLVYAVQSANVESSMCDGRWLMRNRRIMTVNEKEVLRQAGEKAAALALKAGISLPERFPVIKVR